MPVFEVTSPDGQTFEITAPEGATQEQALEFAKLKFAAKAPAAAPKAERSVPEGLARQVGLTARAGMEGLADTAQLVTEPLRNVTDVLVPERPGQPKSTPLGVQAAKLADWMGLPQPENKLERVVQDTSKLMAGTGGMQRAAQGLATRVPGALSAAFEGLASAPVQQATGALGAGLAGGYAKESGAGPMGQFGSALLGGVAGGLAPSVGNAMGNVAGAAWRGVKNEFGQGPNPQTLDMAISQALKNSDFDYAALPARVKQSIRADVDAVLASGKELDPEVLRRLAEFRSLGVTPTRGSVTLDPVLITREKNLAKMGANTADDELGTLARVQNENSKILTKNINEMGELPANAFDAGARHIDSIKAKDAAWQGHVTSLYEKARALPGGDLQIDRKPFIDNIYGALAKQNKMAFLPENVSAMLDQLSAGQFTKGGQTFPVPFDALALDNLMTVVAKAQRSTTDGNAKAALNAVRKAIDDTPLNLQHGEVGGTQVVTQGLGDRMAAVDKAPQAVMDAMNAARAEARKRFQWQESTKPIEAALGGVEPDKFVRRFVIAGDVADVKSLMAEGHPEQLKGAVLAYLKSKALNNAEDEVGTFSQSGYNKALKDLGDTKLAEIFSKEELNKLKTVGRVSSYTQVQPAGSAVNNSNTGAYMAGKMYDVFKSVMTNKVPVIGPALGAAVDTVLAKPIKGMHSAVDQAAALNVGKSLPVVLQTPKSRIVPMLPPIVSAVETLDQDNK